MDGKTRSHWEYLWSQDRQRQNEAFFHTLHVTDGLVDWAYEVWDEVVANLTHKDNHNRAIAAQLLSNLAKSDPQQRILEDFHRLLAVTRDGRFVTARHCLQSLWKIGLAGPGQKKIVVDGLAGRFEDCNAEKNCTLIRFDIIQGLRQLYDEDGDESLRERALALIETEPDLKYRKKYTRVWRDV